jgi:uncharacterized repeat protein (TIGR03987 family)
MLPIAVTFIIAALILYSIGVWAERIGGKLRLWHVVIFWMGLICDSIGTAAMGEIAGGMFQFSLHAITGLIAIVLMAFHAVWATVVIVRKDEHLIGSFHKFSIVVWTLWLVPFISGMINGMIH